MKTTAPRSNNKTAHCCRGEEEGGRGGGREEEGEEDDGVKQQRVSHTGAEQSELERWIQSVTMSASVV